MRLGDPIGVTVRSIERMRGRVLLDRAAGCGALASVVGAPRAQRRAAARAAPRPDRRCGGAGAAGGGGGGGVALRRGADRLGIDTGPDPKAAVRVFSQAWVAGDYRTMYRQLTPADRGASATAAFAVAT